MAMSMSERRRQANNVRSGGAFLKPQQGENRYRLFQFQHKIVQGDFTLQRFTADDYKAGQVVPVDFCDYRCHFTPQFSVCGRIRCLDGSWLGDCERCDRGFALLKVAKNDTDKEAAKRFLGTTCYDFIAVDLTATDLRFGSLVLSNANSDKVLVLADKLAKKGKSLYGYGGRDILITYDAEATPTKRYDISLADPDDNTKLVMGSIKGEITDLYCRTDRVPPEYVDRLGVPMKVEVKEEEEDDEEVVVEVTKPKSKVADKPSEAQADRAKMDEAFPDPVEKAPAAKKTRGKNKPKGAQMWPPAVGQKVFLVFEGDEREEGVITSVGDDETYSDLCREW